MQNLESTFYTIGEFYQKSTDAEDGLEFVPIELKKKKGGG